MAIAFDCFAMFLKTRWFVVTALSIALALISFHLQFRAAHPLQLDESVSEFQQHPASFSMLEEPEKTRGRYFAAIRLTQLQLEQHFELAARGSLAGSTELLKLRRGATYSCLMQFRPAHQSTRDGFLASCQTQPKLIKAAPDFLSSFGNLRSHFMRALSGVTPDAAGLVAGLAIGETSKVSQNLVADMKTVSLTHLTAVSGANCAIVVGLVYFLLKRFGARRLVRTGAALLSLIGYVLLVGAEPSVLRSAVMAAAVLLGAALGRSTSPISALALAILVLLIADPWLCIDIGFALSVLATLGLLLLTKPMASWLDDHLPTWMAISIAVATSAQLFCLPVLLQLQGGISSYSLPANLLSEPLVAPITVLGILACIVAMPFPWLASAMIWLASIAAWCITKIASSFANLPAATFSWFAGVAGVLVALALAASVIVFFRARQTVTRSMSLLIVVAILAASFSLIASRSVHALGWPIANWSIVNCDVGQGDALVIRSDSAVAVVDVGPDDKLIDNCLGRLGVSKIDLLVLTHFDMDHIGGLTGAIGGRQVGTAMVSSFADARWGAFQALSDLRESNVPVVSAQAGFTGKLGGFDFQVLNPSGMAEDSNDGSLVIYWRAPQLNLLTMADLGERGQMRLATNLSTWWARADSAPLVLKVSHHGSADQYPELIEALHPQLSLISVGKRNSYGHPTERTLSLLASVGSTVLRTDEQGAISVSLTDRGLSYSTSGAG